jgi:hypothetical protein
VIGRSRATSQAMLKTTADDIELNDPPNLTDPNGRQLLGMKCHFLEVNTRYYRKRHFPLHQIVWPNADGLGRTLEFLQPRLAIVLHL